MMQSFKCRLCDLAGAELPTGMTEGHLLKKPIFKKRVARKIVENSGSSRGSHGHAQSMPERSTPFKSSMDPPLHVARRTHYPAGFWCHCLLANSSSPLCANLRRLHDPLTCKVDVASSPCTTPNGATKLMSIGYLGGHHTHQPTQFRKPLRD